MKRLTEGEQKVIDSALKNYAGYVMLIDIYDNVKASYHFLRAYKNQCEFLKGINIEITLIEYRCNEEEIIYTIYIYKEYELVYIYLVDFISLITGIIKTIF